jgi:hypothetical protein
MREWLNCDRGEHGKAPRHSYKLDDYGLDFGTIDRVLADYIHGCGVQLER